MESSSKYLLETCQYTIITTTSLKVSLWADNFPQYLTDSMELFTANGGAKIVLLFTFVSSANGGAKTVLSVLKIYIFFSKKIEPADAQLFASQLRLFNNPIFVEGCAKQTFKMQLKGVHFLNIFAYKIYHSFLVR